MFSVKRGMHGCDTRAYLHYTVYCVTVRLNKHYNFALANIFFSSPDISGNWQEIRNCPHNCGIWIPAGSARTEKLGKKAMWLC